LIRFGQPFASIVRASTSFRNAPDLLDLGQSRLKQIPSPANRSIDRVPENTLEDASVIGVPCILARLMTSPANVSYACLGKIT